MSIFSKIGGALKGAAKAVSAPANLLGSAVSHVPVVGGAVGSAIKGVGNLGGMVTGGLPGLAANHFLGGQPAPPPHPSMGGIGMALGQQMPGSPPPYPGPLGQEPASGGFAGALGSAMGGPGAGMPQAPMPGGMGGIMGAIHGAAGSVAPNGPMGGMLGAAPGGIAAILKAQMQKTQGPDASSLLRSQYPGMGGSNEAGNGSE